MMNRLLLKMCNVDPHPVVWKRMAISIAGGSGLVASIVAVPVGITWGVRGQQNPRMTRLVQIASVFGWVGVSSAFLCALTYRFVPKELSLLKSFATTPKPNLNYCRASTSVGKVIISSTMTCFFGATALAGFIGFGAAVDLAQEEYRMPLSSRRPVIISIKTK